MNRNEFFPALSFTRLSVRLTGAALEIHTDDIDDLHVMISGDRHETESLKVTAAADTLTIEQPMAAMAKSAMSGGWMQITIRIPRSWRGSVEARSITGWMSLRQLSGADLSLETVSGMITGMGLDFITVSARAVIGDVKLGGLRCDRCALASTSGDLSVLDAQLKTGSIVTVTGQTALRLLAPFDELTLSAVTGKLSLEAPVTACDAILRSVSGRIRTENISIVEGAAKLRATTVSSDLELTSNLDSIQTFTDI